MTDENTPEEEICQQPIDDFVSFKSEMMALLKGDEPITREDRDCLLQHFGALQFTIAGLVECRRKSTVGSLDDILSMVAAVLDDKSPEEMSTVDEEPAEERAEKVA